MGKYTEKRWNNSCRWYIGDLRRSVDSKSLTYLEWIDTWNKCEDVIEGQRKVKSKGEKYLPRPSGMDKEEYEAYKTRAEFFNAAGRTLDGLHGMMFSKVPIIELQENFRDLLKNVDGTGKTFQNFISEVSKEVIKLGYGGILCDTPNAENILSKKDAEINNIVPFMTFYKPQDIFDVQYKTIGRKKVFSQIKLRELHQEKGKDEFTYFVKQKIRVLSLDENNLYKQRLYSENGDLEQEVYPKKGGEFLDYIPFFLAPKQEPQKSMFEDMIDVMLAWYRKSADVENGAHWTGVPTPYVLGYEPEVKYDKDGKELPPKPICLGGAKVQAFPSGVTHFGYLEFTGSGLQQLVSLMDRDEERMAILGARIISSEKKGVESAEAAEIHRAGENSVLAAFANEMSEVFTNCLIEYISWCKEIPKETLSDVVVMINTDYNLSHMNSSELTALVSCWQSGGISKKVLHLNMQKGELIPNTMSFEEMQEDIEKEKEENLERSKGPEEEV